MSNPKSILLSDTRKLIKNLYDAQKITKTNFTKYNNKIDMNTDIRSIRKLNNTLTEGQQKEGPITLTKPEQIIKIKEYNKKRAAEETKQQMEAIRDKILKKEKEKRDLITKRVNELLNIRTETNKLRMDDKYIAKIKIESIDKKETLINVVKNLPYGKYILKIGNKYITINDRIKNKILKNELSLLNQVVVEGCTGTCYSDAEMTYFIDNDEIDSFEIGTREGFKRVEDPFTDDNVEYNQRNEGAFFKYLNKTKYDLSRYGIFIKGKEEYTENCLISAFKFGGMSEEKLTIIKQFINNKYIPISAFDEICKKINIQINLNKIREDRERKDTKTKYGKSDEQYNINLLDKHFFIQETTIYTSFCIKNYDLIKDEEDSNKIDKITTKNNKKYFHRETRFIDSFNLVKLLLDNKDNLLEEITIDNCNILNSQYYSEVEDSTIKNLYYDETINTREITNKDPKEDDYLNVFFDFETYTNKDKVHIPYLCCICYMKNNEYIYKSYVGENCAYQMLNSLTTKTRLIAHNATYDFRFIIKYLTITNEISRGNHLLSSDSLFINGKKKIRIQIKDSYNLISSPLKSFGKMFKLESGKEIMPYDLYNEVGNIKKKFIDIDYVLEKYISKDDKEQFLNNINKWDLKIDNKYDIIEYSRRYCIIDVEVLCKGYNIFNGWMQEITNININDVITISSLSHKYLIYQGCYKDVLELSGIPQLFIQQCVVGGRCMVSSNEKKKRKGIIQDFDAVSLYPSAMVRLGFLKGAPKVLETNDYNVISGYDGYFIEIKIKSNKKRSFPLVSSKNSEGIRMFENNIEKSIFIDKTTLEDLITFDGLKTDEFEIIRGYYFNDGFNYKIKEVITFLFNERKIKKQQKNPIEVIYKLIMNSAYGKTIMKPIDEETKFFNNKKAFDSFYNQNYNYIKEFTFLKDDNKIKVKCIKPIHEHFNIAQVGVSILSMSKRIMNEVMTLAEDNQIEIFYQDTDSMHLYEESIDKLSKLFLDKYNRSLIGTELGQFHSDFDLKGCDNIYSSRAIFLGKKSYIDELKGTNEKGELETGYHIRLKGIPNSCILYKCKQLDITPYELYNRMYEGEKISFDLTQDGTKANFKFNKDYSVETETIFTREICF
jgi:hypothetical protein